MEALQRKKLMHDFIKLPRPSTPLAKANSLAAWHIDAAGHALHSWRAKKDTTARRHDSDISPKKQMPFFANDKPSMISDNNADMISRVR